MSLRRSITCPLGRHQTGTDGVTLMTSARKFSTRLPPISNGSTVQRFSSLPHASRIITNGGRITSHCHQPRSRGSRRLGRERTWSQITNRLWVGNSVTPVDVGGGRRSFRHASDPRAGRGNGRHQLRGRYEDAPEDDTTTPEEPDGGGGDSSGSDSGDGSAEAVNPSTRTTTGSRTKERRISGRTRTKPTRTVTGGLTVRKSTPAGPIRSIPRLHNYV